MWSSRHLEAVEDELRGLDALVAHLLDLRRDRQAGHLRLAGLLLADEAGHALVGRIGLRIRLHQDEHQAGAQAVRDPHLLPVDLPAAVDLLGGRLDALDVRADLGLRERERAANLARRHLRQVLLLLLVGAELHQQVGADEVRVDDARDRDPAARELLDDHRVGRQVEAHPAVLLGDRDPEQPELLHLLDDRLGELVLVVVLLGVRDDLLVDELADHLDDRLLLVGHLLVRRGRYGHGSCLRSRGPGGYFPAREPSPTSRARFRSRDGGARRRRRRPWLHARRAARRSAPSLAEFAAPDFACAMRGLPPTPPVVWPGVEGIEQRLGGLRRRVRGRPRRSWLELRESDAHVVVIVDQKARTRHGGVELSQPSAMVVRVRRRSGPAGRVPPRPGRGAAGRRASSPSYSSQAKQRDVQLGSSRS